MLLISIWSQNHGGKVTEIINFKMYKMKNTAVQLVVNITDMNV